MKANNRIRVRVLGLDIPKGASLLEVGRAAWRAAEAAGRLARLLRQATPEEQDRIINFLSEQPGLKVTRK